MQKEERICPFLSIGKEKFEKCLGKECELFSIYENVQPPRGRCALKDLQFLFRIRSNLNEISRKLSSQKFPWEK